MKGRIKEKDESVPYKKNGYWYVSRYDEGAQYPVYVRKKESLTAPDEVLIDQNIMAKGFPYFSVGYDERKGVCDLQDVEFIAMKPNDAYDATAQRQAKTMDMSAQMLW